MPYFKSFCTVISITVGLLSLSPAAAQSNTGGSLLQQKSSPKNTTRTIQNPYYAKPAWKLWAKDPTPVETPRTGETKPIAPPAKENRKYPTFPETWKTGAPPLEPNKNPTVAGSWDDCYISLDNYHTRLGQPKNQFIVGGKMRHEFDATTRLKLGANFTSQSYAERGRHIVDDTRNNLNTEKFFFFANCIRATPSHSSYKDTTPAQPTDHYDGLFGHSYHSVGQSGSELHALYKMVLAGAALPRKTKDLLKYHGAYAPALLTLFKATLPFADSEGNEVPYEHELRHRPAYSSHGTPQHPHYCSANVPYHSYDDNLHIYRMVNAARKMTSPPPVAILKLTDLNVKKDNTTINSDLALSGRLMSASLTNIRLWGKPDETLTAIVNLNDSYDLQGQKLSFTGQPVYPNQKNVTVKQIKSGVFEVQVKHDPKLPKGRIPVIFVARNSSDVPSNPVFLNFYWPGKNEISDYGPRRRRGGNATNLKKLPVNINKRPEITFSFPGNALRCKPGEKVEFTFEAKDPEGYPISVYRWPNQPGKVTDGKFTWTVPADAKLSIQPVTLVFSDGTGGYTGKEILLLISPEEDALPDNWALTSINHPEYLGRVTFNEKDITFADQPFQPDKNKRRNLLNGEMVYRQMTGPTDMMLQLKDNTAQVGLIVKNQLEGNFMQARIGRRDGVIKTFWRNGGHTYGTKTTESKAPGNVALRLITQEKNIAGLTSTDGTHWIQQFGEQSNLYSTYYAGVYCGGRTSKGKKPITVQFTESQTPLPMLIPPTRGFNLKTKKYTSPLKLKIIPPAKEDKIVYTLDGKEPTAESTPYKDPIILKDPGEHTVRFAVLKNGKINEVVSAVYSVEEPKKK